jgi:hypothetical protein
LRWRAHITPARCANAADAGAVSTNASALTAAAALGGEGAAWRYEWTVKLLPYAATASATSATAAASATTNASVFAADGTPGAASAASFLQWWSSAQASVFGTTAASVMAASSAAFLLPTALPLALVVPARALSQNSLRCARRAEISSQSWHR